MLVLSRNKEQSIFIGNKIEVKIVDVRGDKVRLGIDAPKDISVLRDDTIIKRPKKSNRQHKEMLV